MSADDRTCPSCGAHVPAGADQCDLCGTAVEEHSGPSEEEQPSSSDGSSAAEEESGPDSGGETEEERSVFCNQCGWENPGGAQFCSRCGEELQDLSDAPPAGTRRVQADLPAGAEEDEASDEDDEEEQEPAEAEEQVSVGRQIALVVGGALFVVLAFFFVTQWSSQYEWGSGTSGETTAQAGDGRSSSSRPSGGQGPAGASGGQGQAPASTDLQTLVDQAADSLTGPVVGQIDSLRTRIRQASGTDKRQLQTELVNLLIGQGHPGRAAVVQKDLAEATGAVAAQRRTADLLYRWMQKLERQGQRRQVSQVARHAAQSYSAVAEKRPSDLDARTRMGESYLLTNNPMRGIKAINAVLEDDSTFVPARFQKGLALLQINRLDQALQQFRKVRQYAEDGSPFYQQAGRAIKVIKKQRAQSPSGSSTPAPETNR